MLTNNTVIKTTIPKQMGTNAITLNG